MIISALGAKRFILGLTSRLKKKRVEYVIFPQKVINITQRANSNFSHKGLEAWDIADLNSEVQPIYAPCTVIVLAKPKSNANTVLFGSCDFKGNPKKVILENGERKILTFNITHDNDISDVKIGQIFKTGEKIGDEGVAGQATGNHSHIEVAEGWQYEKITDQYGNYRTKNIIPIGAIFHQLKGWNTIKRANGYTFKEVERRFFYDYKL